MSLEEIKAEALKLKALRDRKDSLMHELKEVNESISASEEHTLDSLMEDAGVSDVTVDGVRIKRGAIFRGGVTSSSERDKFKFLFDTDNDGALKKKIIINLDDYPNLPDILQKKEVEFEINYSIHHMTLSSIIQELVSEGHLSTEDFDKYSIYAQPRIKVEMK